MITNQLENKIKNATNFDEILNLINKPYRLLFFKINSDYLTEKTYNQCLKNIWITTEFPNADINVSVDDSLKLFEMSNKNLLMTKLERLKLKSLQNEITIYRGTHSKNNHNALSWTDDYETAIWFAKRFNNNGYIIQATIKKDDVLACFNTRNENELIINFNKIFNIKYEKVINYQI